MKLISSATDVEKLTEELLSAYRLLQELNVEVYEWNALTRFFSTKDSTAKWKTPLKKLGYAGEAFKFIAEVIYSEDNAQVQKWEIPLAETRICTATVFVEPSIPVLGVRTYTLTFILKYKEGDNALSEKIKETLTAEIKAVTV